MLKPLTARRGWLGNGWRALVRRRHDLALGLERIGLVSLPPTIMFLSTWSRRLRTRAAR